MQIPSDPVEEPTTQIEMATKISENYKYIPAQKADPENSKTSHPAREQWGKGIEFLLSCISLSVGLGNVWRFPFIALENGGGAFLIPYVCVLVLVGRPVYYLELLIGQFCSRGCIQAYEFAPIMRGVGYGQIFATTIAISYYASVLAITIRYFLLSFQSVLPWSYCQEEWGMNCINSTGFIGNTVNSSLSTPSRSSAELFYLKFILKEVDTIEDGIGMPNIELVGCLALAWLCIGIALIKGIKSSGKALYFLAIFPYVVLIILFIRAITLDGAMNGILYFLQPQWAEIFNVKVWYAAISQAFFSMAICFGALMMCGSYNPFNQDVRKDVAIVTILNLTVSVISGCIIFAILGNLALTTGNNDIKNVVKGGTGLAFISYPDAIAKFDFCPQLFAVLFFMMLLCLGFGSSLGMVNGVLAVIKDRFTNIPNWLLTIFVTIIGFCMGIVYTTPGGQYLVNLVDFFAVSFVALLLAIGEMVAISWLYGVKKFCNDVEFMLGIKIGNFMRVCWGLVAPLLMIVVLAYTLVQFKPLKYNDSEYPNLATCVGWSLWTIGVLQLPIWATYTIYKQPEESIVKKIKAALRPSQHWGPLNVELHEKYIQYRSNLFTKSNKKGNFLNRIRDNIFGQ